MSAFTEEETKAIERLTLQEAWAEIRNLRETLMAIHDMDMAGEAHDLIQREHPEICESTERRHGKQE